MRSRGAFEGCVEGANGESSGGGDWGAMHSGDGRVRSEGTRRAHVHREGRRRAQGGQAPCTGRAGAVHSERYGARSQRGERYGARSQRGER